MKQEKNMEKLIKNARIDTNAKMDEAVLEDVLRALEKSKETKSAATQPNIWRIIVKSPITKLATAVVIIVIAFLGIFEFLISGDGDVGVAGIALARTTEALKKVPWVHISCIAFSKRSDKETKSELWYNNESRISISSSDRGKALFLDFGKNLKYQYNPKTNEIIVSEVTGTFSPIPLQFQEYVKKIESQNINLDISHREDVLDGNNVKVFKLSVVEKSGVRREREFYVDAESGLPLISHGKTLGSDGSVLSEASMVFKYPQEGPATIYDVGGVLRSAKVYGYSPKDLEVSDIEQSDVSESADKLKALGKALLIYSNDHGEEYPDTLQDLEDYLEDLQWFTENVEYLGKGKKASALPDTPLAYDRTLLEKSSRTNVLQNDIKVIFERFRRLK